MQKFLIAAILFLGMNYESIIKPPKSRALKSGRVLLEPGESVGEHITEKREEIIIVLKGTASISAKGKTIQAREGEVFFVPEATLHNVFNNSENPLEYIYVVSLFE